ncbi:hypothetical protein KKF81_06480 [Candidatus Micrarchaeota archaeon]|nr:hypothetical protein [Candidatus Micrarchaeota archaeon]MBU1166574.1 hypothetical protein [Candidatus Micrarchaeota archaeon]MBU1887294.1 hypothetical protein [Candidatus Micrarchaeota archaeon]
MKLVLDKKHGNRIEFILSGSDTSFANMIRRYSMSRVHVLAMNAVTFYDNNSTFWDEYIAHRLGLMPIITPDKMPDNSEITFSLDAEGPKVVYSGDIKSSDKDISVAKDKIVIVTLAANQHLRFEARTKSGIGRDHAKFQAGLVSYGEEDNGLKFFVESFYQMSPEDVLVRGCEVIENDLDTLEAALTGKTKEPKKVKEPKVAKKAKKKKVKDEEPKEKEE